MTLEEMFAIAESHGCYWTLKCESLVMSEYLCEIFSMQELKMLGEAVAKTPAEAFAVALWKTNILNDGPHPR